MKSFLIVFALLFIAAGTGFCGDQSTKDSLSIGLPNETQLEEGLINGGAPNEEILKMAAQKGFKTVIDVRTPAEGTAEEKVVAEKYGLRYINIPVQGYIAPEQVQKLGEALSEPNVKPVVLHCASGGRSSALYQALIASGIPRKTG